MIENPKPVTNLVVVALGSNIGDSRKTLKAAIGELQKLSSTPLLRSSFWITAPVDCPPGSPDFLNAVVALEPLPAETPETLLPKLQALEQRLGRTPKKVLNEPRPLDLDLIAFGREIRVNNELRLPHPRAHLRRFVLAPLSEILPSLVLPQQTRTVSELLARFPEDASIKRVS